MLCLSNTAAPNSCSDPAYAIVARLKIAFVWLAKALSRRASLLVLQPMWDVFEVARSPQFSPSASAVKAQMMIACV